MIFQARDFDSSARAGNLAEMSRQIVEVIHSLHAQNRLSINQTGSLPDSSTSLHCSEPVPDCTAFHYPASTFHQPAKTIHDVRPYCCPAQGRGDWRDGLQVVCPPHTNDLASSREPRQSSPPVVSSRRGRRSVRGRLKRPPRPLLPHPLSRRRLRRPVLPPRTRWTLR